MPVILHEADHANWLDPAKDAAPLFRPVDADEMTCSAVSTFVNNARLEGPQCILPTARKQLADVRELLAGMKARGQENSERYRTAVGIESQLIKMLDENRDRLLEFG